MLLAKLHPQPLWLRVLAALLTVAGCTALYYLSGGQQNMPVVALLYLLPVILSATLWGLWPGIAAALTSFLALNFFFTPPYYLLTVHRPEDILELIVFLVLAMITSQLVGQARTNLAAATAHELEAKHLYELSAALGGLNDRHAIAHILAQHTQLTLQPDCVEVSLAGAAGEAPLGLRLTPRTATISTRPNWIVPLQTAQGLLGEVRIWRQPNLSPAEEQLIRAFANQAVLALERSRLAQAATHTRVLEESDRLKTALLSSVSHELRTPLSTIKAAVTSLRSVTLELDAAARQELLAAVEEETDHLNRLVSNLLSMSRIEAGALSLQRKWNILAEIVTSAANRLPIHDHILELAVSADLPLVPVDFILMEQVFINLISNSLKYSPQNSAIRIEASLPDLHHLLVQVSNQGPLVPEADLGRIFDKFYRLTAAERVMGTGLGLSICKGLVEAHGGQIWARNLPTGFAICFTLPLEWAGESPRLPKEL